jgi:flagellar biosynthesis protein FlhA
MTQSVRGVASPSRGLSAHLLDYLVPGAILVALLVVLAPVPAPIVDLLLAANLTVSVLALLASLAARTPLEMSIFPTFLLGATLIRLVLNVSTTRLGLSRAAIDGASAAGEVVEAFAAFVSANNLVVGAVIFAIIAVVQFVVITAGATRTSEVAARFALDGLPGRQMAIDADLGAGTIDRDQARALRLELQRQADFFAGMDGASRFVRGEAVASVIITMVNLFGGLAIGVIEHGMSPAKAIDVYSRLTIGDGLVTAVPSLLIAVATGLLISRSSQSVDLSAELGRQFTARPHVLLITAVFLGVLSLTGMPFIPLAVMAVAALAGAWTTRNRPTPDQSPKAGGAAASERLGDLITDDRIIVHLGRGLLRLVASAESPLLGRVQSMRSDIAADLGVVVPSIAFRDDLALPDRGYRVTIAGEPVEEAGVARERAAGSDVDQILRGVERAVRRRADVLLTRDGTSRLIESLRAAQPALVAQVVPDPLPISRIHRTLQSLLQDGVPIRPLADLLERMADHAADTSDPEALAEHVRRGVSRGLCRRLRDADGTLVVVRIADEAATGLLESGTRGAKIAAEIRRACRPRLERGETPLLMVAANLRRRVRDAVARQLPDLRVLAVEELAGEDGVEVFATIAAAEAARAA